MMDCHSHLAAPDFAADLEQVLFRAKAAGVGPIVVVGEDESDNHAVLDLCRCHPGFLLPCLGFHPDRFADPGMLPDDAALDRIEEMIRTHKDRLAGIGEVGLDFFRVRSHEARQAQRQCLLRFVRLSLDLDLPLSVHSRSAGKYAMDLLAEAGADKVCFHAFDGKAGLAAEAAKSHGWLFSIPPSVARSSQKQRLARVLPLSALAFESDAPALGPVAGERNEPGNIIAAVKTVAQIRRMDEDLLKKAARENSRRLFSGPAAKGEKDKSNGK